MTLNQTNKKDVVYMIRKAQKAFKANEANLEIGEFTREQRRLELQNLLLILRSELVDLVEAELGEELNKEVV